MRLTVYIDGAARGNPGPAGIGIVMKDENGNVVKEVKEYLGEATNNIAEYRAAIKALQVASQLGAENLTVFCDSELIVNQINGEYRVRDERLKDLCREVKALERNFKEVHMQVIPREENRRADKLANVAINLGAL